MIVVSNTTPIISLASINRLYLLKNLFGEIVIAHAVYAEIKAKKSYGYKEIDVTYIKVKPLSKPANQSVLVQDLDLGEAETILLAPELQAQVVIIDENFGYQIAKRAGLQVVRTLSILLKAKEQGLLTALKPLLDEMILKGRWYSNHVYQEFLTRAGEL